MVFVLDALFDGQRLQAFVVVDAFAHEHARLTATKKLRASRKLMVSRESFRSAGPPRPFA